MEPTNQPTNVPATGYIISDNLMNFSMLSHSDLTIASHAICIDS